jgi:hypothetical protein
LWALKGQSLPALLTTSPPGTPLRNAGIIGVEGTSVVFGNQKVDDDLRSGARFTAGYWLDECQTIGIEGNFFFLEREGSSFFASTNGNTILARPFFNTLENTPDSLLIGFPTGLNAVAGTFHASTFSSFDGFDVYARYNVLCGCCCRVDLLAGYRFLRLHEGLGIDETEISINPSSPIFGTVFNLSDRFTTKNDFNGGEIGLLAEYRHCGWYVQGLGKVALGSNSRSVDINGTTLQNGQLLPPGGFLALTTNGGHHSDNKFSVVPEVGVRLGYQVTEHLRAFVGYSFLYWTNVVRPGDQVDLNVNAFFLPNSGVTPTGPVRPAFAARSSDIWVQGVNFGVEFRF